MLMTETSARYPKPNLSHLQALHPPLMSPSRRKLKKELGCGKNQSRTDHAVAGVSAASYAVNW